MRNPRESHRPSRENRSFARILLCSFMGFAVGVFALLWLLQVVLLRTTYVHTLRNDIESAADRTQAAIIADGDQSELDRIAAESATLIVVATDEGELLYGTDEHASLYAGSGHGQQSAATTSQQSQNPYRAEDGEELSWETGASHYLAVPSDLDNLIQHLDASEDGTVSYELEDATLVYGRTISPGTIGGRWAGAEVLYLSTSMESTSTTVAILRGQLLMATFVSLVLAALLSLALARRLSRPVETLSTQAESLSRGELDLEPVPMACDELDQLEGALVGAAHDLEQANEARRRFLANVAHDLRTPLTIIRGYAEMVQEVSGDDPEQRNADLAVIVSETDRLTDLVNDVLTYTALQDAGSRMLTCEPLDLGSCMSRIAERFAPLCERKGIEVDLQTPDTLLVTGDERQIERVLYNLTGNAIEHAGEGRRVELRLSTVHDVARVEVRDFGPGIPRDELDGIWERYFSKGQIGRASMSSGLGLAISKEILLAHEARFGAESAEGRGTTFWFELPPAN